jgi:hypothetical protein
MTSKIEKFENPKKTFYLLNEVLKRKQRIAD